MHSVALRAPTNLIDIDIVNFSSCHAGEAGRRRLALNNASLHQRINDAGVAPSPPASSEPSTPATSPRSCRSRSSSFAAADASESTGSVIAGDTNVSTVRAVQLVNAVTGVRGSKLYHLDLLQLLLLQPGTAEHSNDNELLELKYDGEQPQANS
jgi:hypothetical protein